MKVTEESLTHKHSKYIEISFFDLNNVAQKRFLKEMGLESPLQGNYDVQPIAIIPIPDKSDM